MCGIVGVTYFDGRPIDRFMLHRMSNRVRHRGPDDEGLFIDTNIGLGIRRLSIIDVEHGHQPIFNEDKTLTLVCNGEIYNSPELRALLEQDGHKFYSNCDVEVIVHLYEKYGLEFITHLNGMFAFAIWDSKEQTLILARDRMGQKPLVYAELPYGVVFGSEIQAIAIHPDIDLSIDRLALDDYLALLYVPTPRTIYHGIRKLRPGTMVVIEPYSLQHRRYWDIDLQTIREIDQGDAIEKTLALLSDSVKIHLRSDVPVGAYLSGGVDSTSIVLLMRQILLHSFNTYTAGFNLPDYDERIYAREAASLFNTCHREISVNYSDLDLLPQLLVNYGEPFADASSIPTFRVAQAASKEVKVLLGGDGGDELFGGYSSFINLHKIDVNPENALKHYFQYNSYIDQELRDLLYHPEWLAQIQILSERLPNISPNASRLFDVNLAHLDAKLQVKYAEYRSFLLDDILTKVDIASMSTSIEVRAPFLDHRLVEWAASLPPSFKVRPNTTKWIIREAFRDKFPQGTLDLPKMGFGAPIEHWAKQLFEDQMYDLLLDSTAQSRQIFDTAKIMELLQSYKTSEKHAYTLFILLVFELWHRSMNSSLQNFQ